jgi:Tfx family DNA-binding protein
LHIQRQRQMQRITVPVKRGPFSKKQVEILRLRARGFTQHETARKLGTSRANVSMIEWRLRKKLEKARDTINAYEALYIRHKVAVDKNRTKKNSAKDAFLLGLDTG